VFADSFCRGRNGVGTEQWDGNKAIVDGSSAQLAT